MTVAVGVRGLTRQHAGTVVRDYISLTKPRVVVLLELTTVCAMVMAQRGWPAWPTLLATVVGGWLSAGGAHALNCWFDRDIDASMARTRHRPVPSGRIAPAHALAFGLALGASAFALLFFATNLLAASLATLGLLFYVLVYTMWLKRSSVQNIVIGGAAGAVPPLVGWAAVTGHLALLPVFLFAIVFYWTPPHFWALALLIRRDYADAAVPMLPVVAGVRETRREILMYTVVLTTVTLLPVLARALGWIYASGAVFLDAGFIGLAAVAFTRRTSRASRRLYYYSLLYIALLFMLGAIDRAVLS